MGAAWAHFSGSEDVGSFSQFASLLLLLLLGRLRLLGIRGVVSMKGVLSILTLIEWMSEGFALVGLMEMVVEEEGGGREG